MTTCTTNDRFSDRARPSPSKYLKFMRLALAAHRQRKQLKNLETTALRDLGLTKAQAYAEADRPIWDVPVNWHR